jgi:hypothetical protein
VTVVDDGSSPEFPIVKDELTRVVSNPYPRSGEIGALHCAWVSLRRPGARAVIMHDSMVLTAPLSAEALAGPDVQYLWNFDRYETMHLPATLHLLSRLSVPIPKLEALASNLLNGCGKTWMGCFGCSMLVTKSGLDRLHSEYGVFARAFMSSVQDREHRQAAERVMGLICAMSCGAIPPALCGCIFEHPSPWNMETCAWTLDEVLSGTRDSYRGPFFKSWVGR